MHIDRCSTSPHRQSHQALAGLWIVSEPQEGPAPWGCTSSKSTSDEHTAQSLSWDTTWKSREKEVGLSSLMSFLSFDLSNVKLQLLQSTKNYPTDEATFLVHVLLCSCHLCLPKTHLRGSSLEFVNSTMMKLIWRNAQMNCVLFSQELANNFLKLCSSINWNHKSQSHSKHNYCMPEAHFSS